MQRECLALCRAATLCLLPRSLPLAVAELRLVRPLDSCMITAILIALVVLGLPTLYFAWHSREFRKFLAGAFFVSAVDPVRSLSRQCFGAAFRHSDCSDTQDQWLALHPPFHFLFALSLFWVHQKTERFRQVIHTSQLINWLCLLAGPSRGLSLSR
jgi:hypothetical protein